MLFNRPAVLWLCGCLVVAVTRLAHGAEGLKTVIVTNDLILERSAELAVRLIVRCGQVTIDGNGATLVGPGAVGDPKSLEEAGIGVLVEGVSGVTLKNVRARGFATGLVLRNTTAVIVSGCDFSDNYHNPAHGWGDLPPRGGILLQNSRFCVIRSAHANRVWNGVDLVDSDDNLIEDCDFSKCSNVCAKLWKSSRNRFLRNDLSYGLRIDRAGGEVHARDSTGVLIETGSNDNYWYRNDVTHGGDGIFIRPLNRWVSTGNVFVENDTSYANNNCIESWSPGNTYIRNKANHGSYGFWLGGSDQTVLIGNEAAFNGLTNGFHNAPEPGFSHGGIVIVAGSSSHTVIEGNYLHDNNGAGLAFRGDVSSQGKNWRTEHWIVQQNRFSSNRFGIWGRFGDAILLAANSFEGNSQENYLTNVSHLLQLPDGERVGTRPVTELSGPRIVSTGKAARFSAAGSRDITGGALRFHWYVDNETSEAPTLEKVFSEPGFHRVNLTVEDGGLASLAWQDLLVVEPAEHEIGTEGEAELWGYDIEHNEDGKASVEFSDDPGALVGSRCLRLSPKPYPGGYVAVVFPAGENATWNLQGKRQIQFWIRALNPNIQAWQNAGPIIRLLGRSGQIEFKPAKDANLLNDAPYSEARWSWMFMSIPLEGDNQWQRSVTGSISAEQVSGISLSFDSWGYDPFTIWLDGLNFR